ncbi:GNAT family N-acetyltransferase [Xenorhabdus budapestensis]|uniref:GNAT family N-acetyltransferase n=1 Tax=Xenorhabdus budapestensis TaxID=290110 RepID=UPI003A887EA5
MIDGKVVGTIGLFTYVNPRRRHVVGIGIGIDAGYSGRGIRLKMIKFAIDYAFNWLACTRIELEVFTDNEKVIESCTLNLVLKWKVFNVKLPFKNGQYCDVMAMSLINNRIL